jgi:hypothetical protein
VPPCGTGTLLVVAASARAARPRARRPAPDRASETEATETYGDAGRPIQRRGPTPGERPPRTLAPAAPPRNPWHREAPRIVGGFDRVVPVVERVRRARGQRSGREIRNGHSMPRPQHRASLIRAAADAVRHRLRSRGKSPPTDDLAAGAAFLAPIGERAASTGSNAEAR